MTIEEYKTQLNELITRFCFRNGRHGETYLLEKGLREGLEAQLIELRNKDVKEVIGEFEDGHIGTHTAYYNESSTNKEQNVRNELKAEQLKKAFS